MMRGTGTSCDDRFLPLTAQDAVVDTIQTLPLPVDQFALGAFVLKPELLSDAHHPRVE
jgi:hypothetical protein